ncbi:MAG: peptidase M3 [Treponema sp.]|nr:peptidase M3 [Treponema sp.]
MNTQDTLPRWKLDTLFSSLESDEYTQALESYRTALTRAEQLLAECPNGQDDFSAWLSSYLTADDAVRAQSRTLSAYTYVVYSTDTTDPAALTALSRIEELGLRLHAITTSFRTILRAHRDQLDDFCAQHPEYERYRRMLSAEAELAAHQMESAQEALASDLQRTGGDAWGRLQEQITSTLSDDASGKTFNAIRNDAYSPDASLRRASYETELRLLKTHSVALAAALNNLKGETLTLNRRRRWDEPLSRALVANRMSRASLDALVTAIEESLPRWREYLRAKARILRRAGATASDTAGTAAEPGLAFYDLFAPLSAATTADSQPSSPVNRSWTFSEAREYIIERYNSFSPAMGRFAQQAFDNGWIDADVRSGKVGGAYDEDFPLGHQSRILVNFTGTFGDVVTLAHELGHAYHFSMLNGQPAHCFDYPMTLAETASTFAEPSSNRMPLPDRPDSTACVSSNRNYRMSVRCS